MTLVRDALLTQLKQSLSSTIPLPHIPRAREWEWKEPLPPAK